MAERESRGRSRDDDDSGRGRSSGGGFKYRERDGEETRRRAESGGSTLTDPWIKGHVKIWKPSEGDNTVRPLPPTWDDAKHYGLDVVLHFGVGGDNGTYLCLQKMKGKACPVCEARAKAVKDGDEEYADELRPQANVIYYILDREKERDGAQVWRIGSRMDSDISMLCVDKKTGETLNIDHPEKGYDLSFNRKGQGLKTRYTGMQIARRSSPVDNDKALEFVQDHPLPDQLLFYSYDHIQKAFKGAARDDDDDDRSPKERVRAKDDDDKDDKPKARDRDDDRDSRPKGRGKTLDMDWDEVHGLKFRKLEELVDEYKLDIDPQASRDDEELADMICEAAGIDKPKKGGRAKDDDDDRPAARTRVRSDDDDDKPKGRTKIEEEDVPTRGRSASKDDDDDDNPRAKLRSMRRE